MRWLFACAFLFGCGDNAKRAPAIDAAPMVDAPIDGLEQFPCTSKAQCTGNACCLLCSPGGACFSQCSADNRCTNTFAMCDPNAAETCLTRDGTPGVCNEMQFGPIPSNKYWVCTSM